MSIDRGELILTRVFHTLLYTVPIPPTSEPDKELVEATRFNTDKSVKPMFSWVVAFTVAKFAEISMQNVIASNTENKFVQAKKKNH